MISRHTAKRVLRTSAIRAGMETIALSGAGTFWRRTAGRGIIFTLHHVRPAGDHAHGPNALLSVTPRFLEQTIATCLDRGLLPLPLEKLPERLADPRDEQRYFCMTLDDGYRDNATFAAPIFRRYEVPYTIFLTRGFIERSRSMWWETVEALLGKETALTFDFGDGEQTVRAETKAQKFALFDRFSRFVSGTEEDEAVERIDGLARGCGIDPLALVDQLTMNPEDLNVLQKEDHLARFGGHTLTHVNLKRVSVERLKREITGSAQALEHHVGYRPTTFAYPYGFAAAAGEREFDAVRAAGFSVGVTTMPGLLDPTSLNRPTGLPRVSLNGLYQRKRYVGALLSGIPFKFSGSG
ncbi:polysaccharide deacetylase family protein [Chelativorans sp. YIM 93263]|uniref:polysaccharide deacetylase family protein n=1 Tax=Chelativorans sp. YIM 93263 TaxID=2906648 RepID=UPI002378ECCC|nr:polysaccharide deacetylase family protein [Chelativorans sp. YIM 93263]